jgi:hypothetical protein
MAHLKSTSYIDIVTPINYAPTVMAFIKTCVVERNFKNCRYNIYSISTNNERQYLYLCKARKNKGNFRIFIFATHFSFYAVDKNQLLLPKQKTDTFIGIPNPIPITFNKCLVTGGLGGIGRILLEQLPVAHKLVIGRSSRHYVELPANCSYFEWFVLL